MHFGSPIGLQRSLQADIMDFPVIKRKTAVEDINFWLDTEHKGWTEADFKFIDDLTSRNKSLVSS